LEKLFQNRGIAMTRGAMRVYDLFSGALFSSFSFLFQLCASIMFILALRIIYLQWLEIIDIFLILIYYLYQKISNSSQTQF
jgi:hypothetical protein